MYDFISIRVVVGVSVKAGKGDNGRDELQERDVIDRIAAVSFTGNIRILLSIPLTDRCWRFDAWQSIIARIVQ